MSKRQPMETLHELLSELSLGELREIATTRRFRSRTHPEVRAIRNKAALLRLVHTQLSRGHEVESALITLSHDERALLDFVISEGGRVAREWAIDTCFGNDEEGAELAIDTLRRNGLLFCTRDGTDSGSLDVLVVPDCCIGSSSAWRNEPIKVGYLLRNATDEALERHLDFLGTDPTGLSRLDKVQQIREALSDGARLEHYVQSLDISCRQALEYAGSQDDPVVVQESPAAVRQGLLILLDSTPLLHLSPEIGYQSRDTLVVPEEVRQALRFGFDTVPTRPGEKMVDYLGASVVPPAQSLNRYSRIVYHIFAFVSAVLRNQIRKTQRNTFDKRALKKFAVSVLNEDTDRYPEFVGMMARACGLCFIDTSGVYVGRSAASAWMQDPMASTAHTFRAWFLTELWNEGNKKPAVTAQGLVYFQNGRSQISFLRKCVARLMGSLPSDRWVSLNRFRRVLLRKHPSLVGMFPRSPGAGFSHTLSGSLYIDDVVESIVCDSLFWLGIVQLDADRGGGSRVSDRCFAVTDLGRDVLQHFSEEGLGCEAIERESEEEVDRPHEFVLQHNCEIVLPCDIDFRVHAAALQFAEIVKCDTAITLKITQDSLRDALDDGLDPAKIEKFLEQHSDSPLPGTVERLISDIAKKHGEIVFSRAGAYLEVADPYRLKEIMSDNSFAKYFLRQVSKKGALLRRDAPVERIVAELRRSGYMPVLQPDGDEPADWAKRSATRRGTDWAKGLRTDEQDDGGVIAVARTRKRIADLIWQAIDEDLRVAVRYTDASRKVRSVIIEPVNISNGVVYSRRSDRSTRRKLMLVRMVEASLLSD